MEKLEIFNLLILLVMILFLLSYFKPSLLLSKTITTGGDTASHFYPAKYMRDFLLPKRKIIGWCPGWFAGTPMFQFYFPPLFAFAALISYVIPLQIAFKLITILGTFLLPISVFLMMRLMKFKFPIPIIAAIFTLSFLFNEGNSMWGGNIPSTLAGEFSYSFSLAIAMLFLGYLYDNKSRANWTVGSLLFALAMLSHIYPAVFAFFCSTFFLRKKRDLKSLLKIYIPAALLVSFWILPLFAKVQYATPYHYVWNLQSIKEVLPNILMPFVILAGVSIFIGFKKLDARIHYLSYMMIVSLLLYWVSPSIGLTDIRFIPFAQLIACVLSAYAIGNLKFKQKYILPLIALVLTFVWVEQNVNYIPYWIKWNYSGFEGKAEWQQFNALMSYLKSLPQGRVVHEYSSSHGKFGTPRAFESIPLFAEKPVLEGLYIESALTAPFVFIIQAEISKTPTCPIPGMVCGGFDLEKATKHLELFNVRYLIATSEKLKREVSSNPDYRFLQEFGEISVYERLGGYGYVILPKYQPVFVSRKNWKAISVAWFKSASEVPLIFTKEGKEISEAYISSIPKIPLQHNCTIASNVKTEEIIINTTCLNKPLLVKIPYFPNWQVEGADKIYLSTPAFMIIYPRQTHIRIYYGKTLVDRVGEILTYIGIFLVLSRVEKRKLKSFINRLIPS